MINGALERNNDRDSKMSEQTDKVARAVVNKQCQTKRRNVGAALDGDYPAQVALAIDQLPAKNFDNILGNLGGYDA